MNQQTDLNSDEQNELPQKLLGSLYAKLATILVVIILTMGFVYGFITFSTTHKYMQEITDRRLY